jgi:EmrB/QacA subfamily drug resistance transporter
VRKAQMSGQGSPESLPAEVMAAVLDIEEPADLTREPVGAGPDAPAVTRRLGPAIAVLSIAVFMSSLDLFIVNIAFPSIAQSYPGTSSAGLSWVLNGYTIVFAALLVPAGRWADRIGRRRTFTAGLLTFVAASALCALAPSLGLLVAARVLQAAGAAALVPSSLSLLLAIVPMSGRAKAIGTWAAVGGMAAALGPVIGGLLVQVNWRLVFWVNVPVGLVAAYAAVRLLPESRDPSASERPDVIGAGVLAIAVGALALGLVQGESWGWTSARVLGAFAVAVLAVAAFVLRCARHPEPVLDLSLLPIRSFSGAFVASVLYYAGFGAFVLAVVEFLTGPWHYSAIRAGFAIAPGPLTVLPFARAVAPRLSAKIGGPGRVAVVGALVGVVAQVWWGMSITADQQYVTHLLPMQILGGAGVGLTIPSLIGAGTFHLPPARFGTGSGVINMGRQLGSVIGVAGLIAVLTGATGISAFQHAAVLTATFFGAAAIASLAIGRLASATSPGPVASDLRSASSPIR